jgi:hypothetical protein
MAKITLDTVGNLRNEATGLEVINDNFDLIEAAFENTLSRDGTSPNTMGANLDMNSNRVINLPSAVAVTEPVRLGDLTLVLSEALEELPDGIDIGLISITPEVQAWLTDPTSAKLATAVSDETGTAGALVFSNSPTITTPTVTGGTFTGITLVDPTINNQISGDLLPEVDETQNIGSSALNWGNLFLGSTASINWEAGDITITRTAPDVLRFSGAASGYEFTHVIVPSASDGAALGTASLMWSDLFLASGAVINFNAGDVTITHSADALAFAGGSYTFAGAVTPAANDGSALGTSALQWADLFLAEGGVINWDNGDVSITQTGNVLSFAGAATRYEFDATIAPTSNDGSALGTTALQFSDLFLAEGGVLNWDNGDVTITQTGNVLSFAGAATRYEFDATIAPTSSDGAALGTTALMFSDLFLASGAVINFNNGDVTATHSANTLTFAGASSGYAFDAPILLSGTTYMDWPEISAPSNPAANTARMYCKDDAGATKLFFRDSTGTETELGGGGAGGSDWVLIETQTASASATLDFTTGLDDTYDAFEFRISSLKPATDDVQLLARVQVSGSYQTTGYRSGGFTATSGAGTAAASLTTGILMTHVGAGGQVGNAAGENYSGVLRFSNPELTTDFCIFEGTAGYKRADSITASQIFHGTYDTVGAVTGIRFLFSSGNIASGRISLYGLAKS